MTKSPGCAAGTSGCWWLCTAGPWRRKQICSTCRVSLTTELRGSVHNGLWQSSRHSLWLPRRPPWRRKPVSTEGQKRKIHFPKQQECPEALQIWSHALGWANERAQKLYFGTCIECHRAGMRPRMGHEVKGGSPKAFLPTPTPISFSLFSPQGISFTSAAPSLLSCPEQVKCRS